MNGLKIVGKVFASIYSMIFAILLIGYTAIFFVGNFSDVDFYKGLFVSVDFKEIPLSELGDAAALAEYGEDATVQDYFVGELTKAGVDTEVSTKLIEHEVLREKAAEIVVDAVNGEIDYENEEEIEQLIIDTLSDEEVTKALEETLPEEQMQQVSEVLTYLLYGEGEGNGI